MDAVHPLAHIVSTCFQEREVTGFGVSSGEQFGYFLFTVYLHIERRVGVCFQIALACREQREDRKSTRLNSSHANISYAVFCLKKKKKNHIISQILYLFLSPYSTPSPHLTFLHVTSYLLMFYFIYLANV